MESLVLGSFCNVAGREPIHDFGNALRRHGADGETVRARVVLPLAAQHHLEMRHRVSVLHAAHAVEAEIADVMLAAGIEAAADLDVQSANSLIHLGAALEQAAAKLARETARRRNAQLAGIGSGACHDIDDRAGSGEFQAGCFQFGVQSREDRASLTQRSTMFCSTVVRMFPACTCARCPPAPAAGPT